jgi:hypothetical protein
VVESILARLFDRLNYAAGRPIAGPGLEALLARVKAFSATACLAAFCASLL